MYIQFSFTAFCYSPVCYRHLCCVIVNYWQGRFIVESYELVFRIANMAEEQEEINPHILRPEDPGSTPASNEGVPPKAFEPSHSHLTFPHSQPFTTPLSHPEPATVEIYDTPATRAYRMTSRKMGNVVMQSSGDSTDQYVILIGNVCRVFPRH
ncbi:hypothetical protein BDZ91DRAFT_716411 [Kalaharituber pfeilii]|nr:hypothetical protein BDZ91DRAFT_716411 [Kalaharituber pfeilii]